MKKTIVAIGLIMSVLSCKKEEVSADYFLRDEMYQGTLVSTIKSVDSTIQFTDTNAIQLVKINQLTIDPEGYPNCSKLNDTTFIFSIYSGSKLYTDGYVKFHTPDSIEISQRFKDTSINIGVTIFEKSYNGTLIK